jgi:hypothetical protein
MPYLLMDSSGFHPTVVSLLHVMMIRRPRAMFFIIFASLIHCEHVMYNIVICCMI